MYAPVKFGTMKKGITVITQNAAEELVSGGRSLNARSGLSATERLGNGLLVQGKGLLKVDLLSVSLLCV